MYENDSTGDWQAFGEKAKELKWIDVVVDRIEETAVLDMLSPTPPPTTTLPKSSQSEYSGVLIKTDTNGKSYYELPALSNPFDAWWIYDPHGLYRAR
jgi:ATP-dependent Clp protease protease subunit